MGLGERCADSVGESGEVEGTVVATAIDEKGRRPIRAAAHTAQEIGLHFSGAQAGGQGIAQFTLRNIERACEGEQQRHAELRLICIDRFVHGQKMAVTARELGGFGGSLRHRMELGKRKVTEDEAQTASKLPPEIFDNGMRRAARAAFVVAIFDECHWCVEIAAHMIGAIGGNLESSHCSLAFHVFERVEDRVGARIDRDR